ncbi:MAG TPA: hypothetical protein PK990_00675 [Salinivirgaceae bacterium]|nr:hypothetical protein [Salinivirgaceae bacterium]
MAKTKEALLEEIRNKVARLTQLYKNCREANAMLTTEIQELKARLDEKELQYKELEERYILLKTSQSVAEVGESKIEARERISKIVREIDQCIELLKQ